MSDNKTNAMRALDVRKIPYQVFTFSPDIHSAAGVAEVVGDPGEHIRFEPIKKGDKTIAITFTFEGRHSNISRTFSSH